MEIDSLTTLAFSMYSNKGAYALLLGSGISSAAQIPTSWEVEKLLISRIATLYGVNCSNDEHAWYKNKFGVEATYSGLLNQLTRTSTERQKLMSSFFEPTESEKQDGLKQPTKAHIQIAKLAKAGYIKIIITTNFDRLLEQALEKEGIIPQVICHEDDITGAVPIIHCDTITILKINGDYKDCRFRNTAAELSSYSAGIKNYLNRILEDFGLITCGWSAKWDKSIVDRIEQKHTDRYTSFFTEIKGCKMSKELSELCMLVGGETLDIDSADSFFTELTEKTMALERIDINKSMEHDIVVARVKKYLSSESYNIEFADLMEKLRDETYELLFIKATYDCDLNNEEFAKYCKLHYSAASTLIDVSIFIARWGKDIHFEIISDLLMKLCTKQYKSGSYNEKTDKVRAIAPILIFYSLCIACVKYNRFKEIDKLCKQNVYSYNYLNRTNMSLLSMLGLFRFNEREIRNLTKNDSSYPQSKMIKERLFSHFANVFITKSEYENYFDIWEHLKSLLYGYYNSFGSRRIYPCSLFIFRVPPFSKFSSKDSYMEFFERADYYKNEWPPIKQGMFEGKYERYKEIYDEATNYLQKNRRI